MKVQDIMCKSVISINKDDTVKNALKMMNHKKINGTPVIDRKDNLVGMIVKADIYRFLIDEGHYDTYPVESVMKKDVVVATLDEEVTNIAKKIRFNDIVSIPVIDKNNKVVGIISMEDIIDYFIN